MGLSPTRENEYLIFSFCLIMRQSSALSSAIQLASEFPMCLRIRRIIRNWCVLMGTESLNIKFPVSLCLPYYVHMVYSMKLNWKICSERKDKISIMWMSKALQKERPRGCYDLLDVNALVALRVSVFSSLW